MIIDPNARLTFTVTTQSFKSVTRWTAQVFEPTCIIKHLQLASGNGSNGFEFARALSLEERQSAFAAECPDHGKKHITPCVKRQEANPNENLLKSTGYKGHARTVRPIPIPPISTHW